MPKGLSLSIRLSSVDPKHCGGWAGELNACEADAAERQRPFTVYGKGA